MFNGFFYKIINKYIKLKKCAKCSDTKLRNFKILIKVYLLPLACFLLYYGVAWQSSFQRGPYLSLNRVSYIVLLGPIRAFPRVVPNRNCFSHR